EQYLARFPGMRQCPDGVLSLVRAEWQRRWQAGGPAPTAEEYQARFPDLADRLDLGTQPQAPARRARPAPPGYEVRRVLGEGGMGVAYLARQVALDRLVALKVMAAGPRAPADLARFRSEALALARLRHPNIVQIFEVGEHQGEPFFSMEVVE